MNTGHKCPICQTSILTNDVIVGLPIIRITGINQSRATGHEYIFHATCFVKRMVEPKNEAVLQLNGHVS